MLYLLAAILLLVIELAYFKLANRLNIIDKPNERSSHTRITLRGGGVIFYAGVLLYFLLFGFDYPWFFAGLSLIAAISLADDIKPQSSRLRLGVHFAAMLLMFNQWGLYEQPWYFWLVALVFCTGVLNAYNFMDGINGITGGYSLVVVGALWYINTHLVVFVDNNLLYVLLMAIGIFNVFNFRTKAVCFAGDVGAISIAFTIVFLLGLLILRTGHFSYILLLALYGVDTILTIIHRLMLRENIFQAHRKHLFQLMANELKIPHVVVSLVYMLLQALVSFGLIMTSFKYEFAAVMVVLFVVVYVVFMKKYYRLHMG
jgi:UDP-N-acetylmuramyl pentapeptide phosphotransferase/UDP-N-acetylglucosamine-1-phosphate transferase